MDTCPCQETLKVHPDRQDQLRAVLVTPNTESAATELVLTSKATRTFYQLNISNFSDQAWDNTMQNIVNLSHRAGTVLTSIETAVVKPLSKKPRTDPESFNSY